MKPSVAFYRLSRQIILYICNTFFDGHRFGAEALMCATQLTWQRLCTVAVATSGYETSAISLTPAAPHRPWPKLGQRARQQSGRGGAAR